MIGARPDANGDTIAMQFRHPMQGRRRNGRLGRIGDGQRTSIGDVVLIGKMVGRDDVTNGYMIETGQRFDGLSMLEDVRLRSEGLTVSASGK